MPKIAYGQNVQLLYPDEIPAILKIIESTFIEAYGEIGSWETWEVQRIDPCYAWKFPTNEDVKKVLRFLNTQEYPTKDKHWYKDETITFGGRSFSVTFYAKHQEYMKYAYKKLTKLGFSTQAEQTKNLSEGLLRYELRLFKPKLSRLFNKDRILTTDILDLTFYYTILNACLTTVIHNPNRSSIGDSDALTILLALYKKEKALRLFYFWKMYYSPDTHITELIKDHTNATTIARNLQEIAQAGIGIPDASCSLPFALSIPSKNAVTSEPAPRALAPEPDKKIRGVQQMFDLLFED